MPRGPDPLPPTVVCADCGKPFPLNDNMRARVRKLEALGLADAIGGFVCAGCAGQLDRMFMFEWAEGAEA